MKKKLLVCLLAVTMLVTMLAGCGTKSETAGDDKKVGKPIKDSITVGLLSDMGSLDPITSARAMNGVVGENIYDTLVCLDGEGKVIPHLAENWKVSDDGITYTFYLRKGIKFHNGEELKSKDTVYTINSCVKSPYMAAFVPGVKEATVIDDYSFTIVLTEPSTPFILNLRMVPILNEKAVTDAAGKYGQDNAVGTGAYKFVSHSVGQSIKLERNEEYWGTKPQIKTVEFKIITDSNSAVIALKSGDIDALHDVPATSFKTIKNSPDLSLIDTKSLSVNDLFLNVTKKPFNNVVVRQAVSYAVDKDAIIQMAENGMATKADHFINKYTFGYTDKVKGYEYNVEKAKELLKEAGYPNGFKVTLKTFDGEFKKIAEVIQESLSKVGITVDIQIGELNSVIGDLMGGNFEMGILSIGLLSDIDFWSMVYTSTGPYNLGKYKSPKVDELFAKGKKLSNENDRLAVYEQLLQTIKDDAPIISLCHPQKFMAINKDLKVTYFEPSGMWKVDRFSWAVK